MSPTTIELNDGSSTADAHPLTRINRDGTVEPYRFRCPNNHTSWDRTNGGILCHSCARQGLDPPFKDIHSREVRSGQSRHRSTPKEVSDTRTNPPPKEMYDRVLIAVDGSDEATRAASHGLAFARAFDATAEVLHVVDRKARRLAKPDDERAQLLELGELIMAESRNSCTRMTCPSRPR